MDPKTWQRVEQLFGELVDLADFEQQSRLEELRRDEPGLAREVESLLRSEVAGSAGLTEGVDRAIDQSLGSADAPLVGHQVGLYEIIEPLGSGGFGTVYRARQSEPVQREVALKVIRPGLASPQVVERFERERQTVARMAHPGIAQVFDAGTTAGGEPWFAMELVEGLPITAFCRQEDLALEEVLDLFRDVCAAVQHAHQRAVIHRDLKPSNVLVLRDEAGVARPKVIDFGIARALENTDDETAQLTQVRQVVGTLEYMSPEQAQFGAAEVDTRSDVYSLGVLLYELLTGTTPLADALTGPESGARGVDEALRRVREQDAERPSRRSRTLDGQARLGTRTVSGRRLRGDLDWITLKALEKDPSRRYGSAAALGDDLQRHQKDLPVEAGPPSSSYRLSKFYRRNRAGVLAAVVAAFALVTGLVLALVGLQRASAERDRALAAEQNATQVTQFLVELFEGVDPEFSRGREVAAREILDLGAARLDALVESEPEVGRQLLVTVGKVYASLGLYESAEQALERAVQVAEERAAGAEPSDPGVGASLLELARLRRLQNRFTEAEELAQQALEEQRQRYGERSAETAEALALVGALGYRDSDMAYVDLLQQSLEIRREVFGADHPKVGETLLDLGQEEDLHRRFPAAVEYYDQALRILETSLDSLHPDVLDAKTRLVRTLAFQKDGARALPLAEGLVRDSERVFGAEHPKTAAAIGNRGSVHYRATGDQEAAFADFRRAEEILVAAVGLEHPEVNEMRRRQAFALMASKRFEEALEGHLAVLETDLEVHGPEHGRVMRQYYNIGVTAQRADDHELAADYLRRHLDFNGPDKWRQSHLYANPANLLARSLMQLGSYGEAEELLEVSYGLMVEAEGPAFPPNAFLLESLIELNERWARTEEVERWRDELARHEAAVAEAGASSGEAGA